MIQSFLFVNLGEERSLEIAEVLRRGGRRWWRQEAGLELARGNARHKFCFSGWYKIDGVQM